MSSNETRCANGRTGYDIDSGKAYTPKPACSNDARPGHILCDSCRAEIYGLKMPARIARFMPGAS